jgi:hypothetical protein
LSPLFISWQILSGSFTHAWHPGASDIAGNGIMFASNDRVGAAAAGMIMGNSSVFIMAGLIMVSTFGCNSGLILWWAIILCDG